MRIGIFSDSYLPQVSGVTTSIKTLKDELEAQGHTVYIFTTTNPNVDAEHPDPTNVIRFPSVPFISATQQRVVLAGLPTALRIARHYQLDIIHTQTEFGVGILGKIVANRLHIPVIHTLHTKYEDYLHYIANGKLIRPPMVKHIIHTFLLGTEGVICPSEMTEAAVKNYGVKIPIRIIPTGVEISKFIRPDITENVRYDFREKLGLKEGERMLVNICRISMEKNIQAVIRALPEILEKFPVKLILVGDGPYKEVLEALISELKLENNVIFVGEVENDRVVYYYKAADFFISASTSETQGLTFSEALASRTPVLAYENPYMQRLIDKPQYGSLFSSDDEIAKTTIEALEYKISMTTLDYHEKLYEVSSQNFEKQVVQFYQYMIENYRPFNERISDRFKLAKIRLRETGNSFTEKITKYVKIDKDKKEEDK